MFLRFLYGIKGKAFLSSILGDPPSDPLFEDIECDRGGETAFRTKIPPH